MENKKVVAPDNMGRGLVWNAETNQYDVKIDDGGMELVTTVKPNIANTYAVKLLAEDGNYYLLDAVRDNKPSFVMTGLREANGAPVFTVHNGAAAPYGITFALELQNYNETTDLMNASNVRVSVGGVGGTPIKMTYRVEPTRIIVSLYSTARITQTDLDDAGTTDARVSATHLYSGASFASASLPIVLADA